MEKKESRLPKIYNNSELEKLKQHRKDSKIKFLWSETYSKTNELDKHGRWERKCFIHCNEDPFDRIIIGYIGQPQLGLFNYHTCFSVTGNDYGIFSDIEHSEYEAKLKIEILFVEFINKIKSHENFNS